MKKILLICASILLCVSCKKETRIEPSNSKKSTQLIHVKKAKSAINIDGVANESIWQSAEWHQLDHLWLGDSLIETDFSGRYKLSWTNEALFLLAEIKDDTLFDQHQDPLTAWWDDDCLEIFIDEDNSGGNHQFNHNAFAYHVALDGNVVDMSTAEAGKLFNSDIQSALNTKGNTTIWEVKVLLFDDTYDDTKDNTPVELTAGKYVGFALAYCDNDGSLNREHFIGSLHVEGEDKNRGWIDADIFGTLVLEN
ncbi:sugar-binding protein [Psychroserpens sp.]|uniref:sugar-binding protein n=1 Tax=Psychroserpens sp. TaxID=2020870 RepID=UPI001B0E88FE|nr:sugar-binding protein [Psychroserpens sp.]MBO6607028.1 CBM9 family sugar-binding protein [Psychroserpens sp.]MBO6631884.1 CBM9 family sugar-binding protein [Psychroserpens sp.]MBO6654174.1 CBM9 family sugar-binding protein [Psychroserpens sp.]MBO6682540.1 CBM9 family sugar-binding protein [Psychroserpens sp.]MBO6750800.1 CBM9 family sugar-binding protein [Psychroserpens sp.]